MINPSPPPSTCTNLHLSAPLEPSHTHFLLHSSPASQTAAPLLHRITSDLQAHAVTVMVLAGGSDGAIDEVLRRARDAAKLFHSTSVCTTQIDSFFYFFLLFIFFCFC